MFRGQVHIANPVHMRPAHRLVETGNSFQSKITLIRADKEIAANSIMAILAAGITRGDVIEVRAEGVDEVQAGTAVVALLTSFEESC